MFSHYLLGGPWGDYGVRLFFVLSGFLITSTLLAHREHMSACGVRWQVVARNFYIRRSLRLFPVYYLALLAGLILVELLHVTTIDSRSDWYFHFGYLTNILVFLRGEWLGVFSPYWSLAVEEQFYLLWFWIVLYVKPARLAGVIGLVILSAPLFRLLTYLAGKTLHADVLLPACTDTLASGALLAVVVRGQGGEHSASILQWMRRNSSILCWGIMVCALLLMACSFAADKNSIVRRLMVNILSAVIFSYVVFRCYEGATGPIGRLLTNPMLIAVGKISYGIYVYHMLVLLLCKEWLIPSALSMLQLDLPIALRRAVDTIVPVFFTLALANMSWVYFEAPILRLKRRFSEGLGSV